MVTYQTVDEWTRAGIPLGHAERTMMWRIGEWWAAGAAFGYGVRTRIVSTKGWEGPTVTSCREAARIARRFPSEKRQVDLTFAHHQNVATLPDRIAIPLLKRAAKGNWSANRTRIAAATQHTGRGIRPPAAGSLVTSAT